MTSDQQHRINFLACQIGTCDAAINLMADTIDTQLADALRAIGSLLERINADLSVIADE